MTEYRRIILDTHIWIWLMEHTGDLSEATIRTINQMAKQKRVLIAAISLWEVCMLAQKKRLRIKGNVLNWLNNAVLHPGVVLCPLTPAVAFEACNLPRFHADPADRLIVATARIERATLFTHDENILHFGKSGQVSVSAA